MSLSSSSSSSSSSPSDDEEMIASTPSSHYHGDNVLSSNDLKSLIKDCHRENGGQACPQFDYQTPPATTHFTSMKLNCL